MKVYKFEVIVTEEENSTYWDAVNQYETPTNRWVKRHIEDHLSDGELMDIQVNEISVTTM